MTAELKFALIGTGFMGKAHAIALGSVATVFPDVPAPVREILVDAHRSRAQKHAKAWGFHRATDDWLSACLAPDVDVVDICTPNHLHRAMALAGIAHDRAIEADFEAGWRVQAVIDAIEESDRNRCWTSPAPTPLLRVPARRDGQKTAIQSGGQ